jgi:pyruvate dehydrogenase E1 component alpha subunit
VTKKLERDDLLKAYRTMRTIREFEERLHTDFATGEIPGFVHLYAGEEASATGVCMNLTAEDHIASTHRGHGHCIAKGVDPVGMMAEIWGRKTGTCKGKGGSMHIADLSVGMLGANGIVGGGGPLVCGTALAAKLRGQPFVSVCFFGDGASNQGTIFEAMNLASVWNLPVIFLAENNGYAEATSSNFSVACDNIADRASAFGMPGITVDGFDFFAVYEAAGAPSSAPAGRRSVAGGGEAVPLLRPLRGRPADLPRPGEVQNIRDTKDCLLQFARRVTSSGRSPRPSWTPSTPR